MATKKREALDSSVFNHEQATNYFSSWPKGFTFQCIQSFDFNQNPNILPNWSRGSYVMKAGTKSTVVQEESISQPQQSSGGAGSGSTSGRGGRGRGHGTGHGSAGSQAGRGSGYSSAGFQGGTATTQNPVQIPKMYRVTTPTNPPRDALIPGANIKIWPVGFPFRARRPYTDTDRKLSVEQGQFGHVLRVVFVNDQPQGSAPPWFQVAVRGVGQMLVPYWCCEMGRVNCIYHVTSTESFEIPTGMVGQIPPNNSVLFRTLNGLMSGLKNLHELQALTLEGRMKDVVTDATERNRFLWKIMEGIRDARLETLMQSGSFDIEALLDRAVDPNTLPPKSSGIYIIRYQDFKKREWKEWKMIYVGQSSRLRERMKEHATDATTLTTHSLHYKLANNSHEPAGRSGVICNWPADKEIKCAEQIILMLFDSMHPSLTTFRPDIFSASDPQAVDDSNIRRYGDVKEATIVRKMALEVFRQTGWRAFCRPGDLGANQGLNRSSPMSENEDYSRTLWTVQTVPGRMSVFRRGPVKAGTTGRKTTVHVLTLRYFDRTGKMFAWNFEAPTITGIEQGMDLYPAFEICETGAHPTQYARLPLVGPIDDWLDAQRVALRIDFVDKNGNWQRRYIQSGRITSFAPGSGSQYMHARARPNIPPAPLTGEDNVPGVFDYYVKCKAIYNYFKQIGVQNDYPWMHTMGNARIKEIIPHVLDCRIEIKDKVAPPVRTHRARKIASDEHIPVYQAAGLTHINEWRDSGIKTPGSHQTRHKCDGCATFTVGTDKFTGLLCRKRNDRGCHNCSLRGIPCSWSPQPFGLGSAMNLLLDWRAVPAHLAACNLVGQSIAELDEPK